MCLQRRHDRAGQQTLDEDGRVILSEGRAVASRCSGSGCIRWCTNLQIIVHLSFTKNLVIFTSILWRERNGLHIYVLSSLTTLTLLTRPSFANRQSRPILCWADSFYYITRLADYTLHSCNAALWLCRANHMAIKVYKKYCEELRTCSKATQVVIVVTVTHF